MNNLQKQTSEYAAQIAVAQTFADKYGDQLPPPVCGIMVCTSSVEAYISIGYLKADRERVLTLVREVFGAGGWTRRVDYGKETFSWRKTVDGVLVVINRVESIDIPLNDSPVPENAFPLQLKDAA